MAALDTRGSPSITFTDSSFSVDTYTVTVTFTWTDPNYQLSDGSGVADQRVQFTTTNSAGLVQTAAQFREHGPQAAG